jgi:hypothetical protein
MVGNYIFNYAINTTGSSQVLHRFFTGSSIDNLCGLVSRYFTRNATIIRYGIINK